jgi:broad specificity phosphatase PhoE
MIKIRDGTNIFFIRHGQTPSNLQNIKQGVYLDDYLNTKGILEVQAMVPIIKTLDLDLLYTSHLHRAEETAAIIRQQMKDPIPVYHDFRLRERDFGSLSGKHPEEIKTILPDFAEREHTQTYDYQPFGGESAQQVHKRVLTAVLDIAINHDHQNIGIITHGGAIRALLFHFREVIRIFHQASDQLKDVANCDIYEWQIDETDLSNLKAAINQ